MPYILALDSGTTSARAILFDRGGAVRAVAQKEITQHYPQPGWVEHDPLEIWTAQISVAVEALGRAGIGPRDVAAVGITNQRETTVVWDRQTGEPVCNAIVWQDRRTAQFCDRLRVDGCEKLIRDRTGLVIDAYFSGSKIAWILDNIPGARAKAEAGRLAFGTVDSWLVWKLTDGKLHVTDSSNASRTMLFDIHRGTWDDELLKLFRISRSMLPEVRPSSGVYGEITSALGLGSVPIAGMAGDQQAALFGQLCTSPGLTKNTYGTGCFMLQCTGPTAVASKNHLITTIAWTIDGRTDYALEGSVFIAGAVVQWLRDGLGIIRNSEEVNTLAATVPDNGGVYLVPAFAGLGAPHWDPYARGTIVGITRGTTAGHFARAALEGIAFQSADLLDAMRADAGHPVAELRVDGGACRSDLLMQFQADLLRVPVVRPAVTETTALGAAYLAGLGVGYWKSPEEIATQRVIERRFEPSMNPTRVGELRAAWYQAVEQSRVSETQRHTAELERRVAERTAQMSAVNEELESFAYSVSHDLRAPLRAIDGFGQALLEDYAHCLDDPGRDYLDRIRKRSQQMGELIDDLLALSRVNRGQLRPVRVDLSDLAGRVVDVLRAHAPERSVTVMIQPGVTAIGDSNLLRIVLDNLLGNAWKFTGKTADARIEFGQLQQNGDVVYFVRDNGAGYDPVYADALFEPFQRLHSSDDFDGHGSGLATVRRVVTRHGGRTWAEGQVGLGATIFFTLGPAAVGT